ncbi:MAG: hypothetical protein WA754_06905, partial [Pseudolabrys sp.]
MVYSLRLLRAQRWSPQRRAAEQRDEIAALPRFLLQLSPPVRPSSSRTVEHGQSIAGGELLCW